MSPSFSEQMDINTAQASSDPGGQWQSRQVQGISCTCVLQRTQYGPDIDYAPGINDELYWFRCIANDWPGNSLPAPDMQVTIDGGWYKITEVVRDTGDVQFFCERSTA